MNVKKIIAGIGALALSAGLSLGLSSAAQASIVPVIYNYTNGWASPQVRPALVTIGQGGAPYAHTRHWNAWNATRAKSTGTLVTDNCIPNCALGEPGYHKLYVTMSGIKYHKGRAYYSVMKWYTPGSVVFGQRSSTVTFHFRKFPGGNFSGWITSWYPR
jgi:hypothetical protein